MMISPSAMNFLQSIAFAIIPTMTINAARTVTTIPTTENLSTRGGVGRGGSDADAVNSRLVQNTGVGDRLRDGDWVGIGVGSGRNDAEGVNAPVTGQTLDGITVPDAIKVPLSPRRLDSVIDRVTESVAEGEKPMECVNTRVGSVWLGLKSLLAVASAVGANNAVGANSDVSECICVGGSVADGGWGAEWGKTLEVKAEEGGRPELCEKECVKQSGGGLHGTRDVSSNLLRNGRIVPKPMATTVVNNVSATLKEHPSIVH
jgi:hypothetical protein